MEAEELNAISCLKNALSSEPVPSIYSREAPAEVNTDASKDGFGAVLTQEFDQHQYFIGAKRRRRAIQSATATFWRLNQHILPSRNYATTC